MHQQQALAASEQARRYAENIRKLRDYTGEGMMACRKAYDACGEDILLAVGYLKYAGSLVNLKGRSHEDWLKGIAEGYKQDLALDESGNIVAKN